MEPRMIREGGRNYGAAQRAGPVSFGTVVLKRGMTRGDDLWQTFHTIASGAYAVRLGVTITLLDGEGRDLMAFALENALPLDVLSNGEQAIRYDGFWGTISQAVE